MLFPLIFFTILIITLILYRRFSRNLKYFWLINLAGSLVLTTILWQFMFLAIAEYADRKISHTYVLKALVEKGYAFNPNVKTLLAPPLVYGYRPRGRKSALEVCGSYCLDNYCKGIEQNVLYPNIGSSKGVRIEYFVGPCNNSNPKISNRFDDHMKMTVRKYEFGNYPDHPNKKIYIGYLSQLLNIKTRVQGYYYQDNLVSYELILDFWDSKWLPFSKFTYAGNETLVRRSGWPEFVNVGDLNGL